MLERMRLPLLEALTHCLCSPAARPTSTWASSWRRSNPTRMQPPTTSWPGSTAIMPTLPSVRQPAPAHVGAGGSWAEEPPPCCGTQRGSQVVRAPPTLYILPASRTGFKLAFNYLKDKRFVEAIEVCHNVRHQHRRGELGVVAWDGGRGPRLRFHTLSLPDPGPRRAPQLPQNQRRNFGEGPRVSAALAMVSESQGGWKPMDISWRGWVAGQWRFGQ